MLRKKFKRKLSAFICLFEILAISFPVSALTTVNGYVSINNSTETDYKTKKNLLFDISGEIKNSSDYKEIINYDENQRLSSDSILNYLIENNLLSSDLNLEYDGIKIKSEVVDKFYFRDNDTNIRKSDFLATLGKALYGVKESRPIVFNTKSIRWVDGSQQILYLTDYVPDGYKGSDTEFDYSNGDYSVFVSPNVYEMYFKDLLSSGIVDLDEFSDTLFIESYNKYGTVKDERRVLPLWSESLGLFDVLSNSNPNNYSIQSGTSVLGSGFKLEKDGFNVKITNVDSSWFFEEDLLYIDALRYVEKALRKTEKDMSKLESDIINYKYGVKYLERVPSDYVETVKYLIAKGVIDFEDENEFKSLFKPLSSSLFRKLIYRVHNKDARVNFSNIQLTDSDNYWLSRGFNETSINLYEGSAPKYDTEVEEVNTVANNVDTNTEDNGILANSHLSFLGSRSKVIASTKNKEFIVTRVFNTSSNTYYYKDIELKGSTKTDSTIIEVKEDKNDNLLKVKFKIKANSSVAAVAILDANMKVKNKNGVVSIGSVPAVAYSESSGTGSNKVSDVFIPKSALNSLTGFPIFVSEDKYLINKESGASALILEDSKKALIGNQVFNLKDTMVYGLNGEVYYNLQLIKYLLSESMLSSLDNGDLFFTKGYPKNEKLIKIKNNSNSDLGNLYVKKLTTRSTFNVTTGKDSFKEDVFYNLSQSNSLSNFLIYDLSKDLKSDKSIKMILELSYVFPESSDVGIDTEFLAKYKNKTLTTSDVYNYMYKRPNTKVLQDWWDSNLTFSNALINYIMGTESIKYVKSGFLMPSITILGDLSSKNSDEKTYLDVLNSLFETSLGLNESFINSTKSNTKRNLDFIHSYFHYESNFLIDTGNKALDGLISERTFNYIVGSDGKYEKSPGIYEKSNYSDFYEYAVLESNGNVYHKVKDSKYFEGNYSYDKSSINLKEVVGLKYVYNKVFSYNQTYYINSNLNQEGWDAYTCLSNSNGVIMFAMNNPISFYYKDGDLYTTTSKSSSVSSWLTSFADENFGKGNYSIPKGSQIYGKPNVSDYKKGYYRIGDKYYKVKKDGGKLQELKNSDMSELDGEKVNVYLTVALPSNLYAFDENTMYVRRVNNDVRYDLRNVTNVGIVNNIIESIVFNNSSYVNFSKIPNNAKVIIGYNVFEKSGGYLQSSVVSGNDVISLNGSALSSNSFPDSFKSIVSRHIGNIPITSSGFGDINSQFIDYVKDLKFGKGQSDSKYDRTLKLNSKGSLVVTETILSNSYSKDTPFNSFCYSFKLKDGVVFKEIGNSGRYTLVPISNDRVDGDLTGASYFVESLSYSEQESVVAGLFPSEYRPASRLSEFAEAILASYDIKRVDDFLGLLSYLIRLMCTWLIGTNTLLLVLRNDVIDSIVYDIKYPNNNKYGNLTSNRFSSRFSFDIYSFFTFGLQSVDSKPSLIKGLVISGVLFVIASLLSIGYFG